MTPRGSSRARAERVFRALLRLLPLDFRNEHGREMEQVFRAQRGDAGDGTPLTVARFWLDTAQDVLRTAPAEHLAILKQDTTYAVRALRRAPAFSLAAILTLAIGIGATTALFTILNAFLFRPLPVERPGELVSVATLDRHIELPHGLSLRDLEDYRSHNAAFSDLVGCMPLRAALNSGGGAEPIAVEAVTGNYFSVLGVPPALGRVIGSAEGRAQGDAPVLVLTYDFWRRRFAGDASVVGRAVRLNGRPFTIVGVAAAGFHSTEALLDVSAFVPVSMVAALSGTEAAHPSFFEIGLYGVIAYHVTQRSHEIGVRLALGAQPSAIVASVLGRGARFATAGAVVGIALAAAVGRFVRPLLLGVSPFDAATYASVTLVLVAVALAASLVPARRAVSVDPLESLRID